MSMSFRAANIVAANRMANFLSSVTRELYPSRVVSKQLVGTEHDLGSASKSGVDAKHFQEALSAKS
jgi:hypothetical protein